MSLTIDEHFFQDLFINKKVDYYGKFYLLMYDIIWPSEESFINFLNSSDISLKIQFSKEIYNNFTFSNDLSLPSSIVLSVLNDQYKDYENESDGYVSQDHIIHCINLYILGVYLFFNSEELNSKLLNINSDKNCYTQIKEFILKWQIFSLYHDIGYFFEDKDLSKKELEIYKSLKYQTLHHLIINNIANTFAYKFLAESSNCPLNKSLFNEDDGTWYDISKKIITRNDFENEINFFYDAPCFNGIQKDEDIFKLLPLLKDTPYLTIIFDEHVNIVALVIRKQRKVLNIFSKTPFLINSIIVNNTLDHTNKNFFFRYYVKNIHDFSFWESAINSYPAINEVSLQFPQKLNRYALINSSNIKSIIFKTYSWILESLPLNETKEEALYDKNYHFCQGEYIKKYFHEKIDTTVKSEDINNDKFLEDIVENLCKLMSSNKKLKNIKKDINSQTDKLYEERFGTTHNFAQYYKDQINLIKNDNNISYDIELDFNEIFKISYSNDFSKMLLNKIIEISTKMSIDFNQLINYRPKHASYDHGIASASLIFQLLSFSKSIKDSYGNNSLKLSWSNEFQEEQQLDFYSDIIFSILLHNIYCKKYDPYNGVDYEQNIHINPFSYFCALCDTIQKWGRPKKVNLSKVDLPYNNYLEDEFDIAIIENHIQIKCLKKDLSNIQNIINDAETFLPGISTLIKINAF